MSAGPVHPPFITFYSFKGGVGRSMTLINVAALLAGIRGYRVLVIDFDLEAPGLSYLPAVTHGPVPGVVDLLLDARGRGDEADLFKLSPAEIQQRFSFEVEIPKDFQQLDGSSLRVMPAGRFDGSCAANLETLNLGELYRLGFGEPLIRAFKQKLGSTELYEYVFVDSRTGFSDETGICTRDLADLLVVVSGLNRQNIEGTGEFLRALRSSTGGKRKLQLVFSPVPTGEEELCVRQVAEATASYEKAWGQPIRPIEEIGYLPELALLDLPYVFRRSKRPLADTYRRIENRIRTKGLTQEPMALAFRLAHALKTENPQEASHIARLLRGIDDAEQAEALLRLDGLLGSDALKPISIGRTASAQDLIDLLIGLAAKAGRARFAIRLIRALSVLDTDGAERWYQKLAGPTDDRIYQVAHALFLARSGRLAESETAIGLSFIRIHEPDNDGISELFLLGWIVSRLRGKDPTDWERYLKWVSNASRFSGLRFEHCAEVVEFARTSLTGPDFAAWKPLHTQMATMDIVAALTFQQRWAAIPPLDPTATHLTLPPSPRAPGSPR